MTRLWREILTIPTEQAQLMPSAKPSCSVGVHGRAALPTPRGKEFPGEDFRVGHMRLHPYTPMLISALGLSHHYGETGSAT